MRDTPGLPSPEPVHPPQRVVHDIDNLVYASLRGRVAALDRNTGAIVWKWKAPKGKSYATVLVDGDVVIAGVYGYLYCLDAATGEQRWANPMKGFGTGVTSLATRRGSNNVTRQAAEAEAAAAVAATAAAT